LRNSLKWKDSNFRQGASRVRPVATIHLYTLRRRYALAPTRKPPHRTPSTAATYQPEAMKDLSHDGPRHNQKFEYLFGKRPDNLCSNDNNPRRLP
jgi:hypothetical protein